MKRLLAAATLSIVACAEPAPSRSSPPDVAMSGCAAVRADGLCELADHREIRVSVVASPGARVTVESVGPGVVIPNVGSALRHATVRAHPAARALVVVVEEEDGAVAVRHIAVAPRRRAGPVEEACSVVRKSREPRAEDAPAALALTHALRDEDPFMRSTALRCLGRAERARGKIDVAIRHLGDGIEIERAEGRLSEAVDDHLLLGFIHLFAHRDLPRAEQEIAAARGLAAPYAEGAARVPYFEALLARERGELRVALRSFDEAIGMASRLGLEGLQADALAASADALGRAGRHAEATARARAALVALPIDAPPCEVAAKLGDVGWTLLRTPVAERSPSDEPSLAIEQSLALAKVSACPRDLVANGLTNLALAAAEQELWDDALRLVEEARRMGLPFDPRVHSCWANIEGGAALGKGAPRLALERFDELASAAEAHLLPDLTIEAAVGRARALVDLDRADEAERAFGDAERAADRSLAAVPLGGGRDAIAASQERTARIHIDFMLSHAWIEGERSPGKAGSLARSPAGTPPWFDASLTGPRVARAAQVAVAHIGRTFSVLQSGERIASLQGPLREAHERAQAAYLRARDEYDRKVDEDRRRPADQREQASARQAKERARLRDLLEQLFSEPPLGAGDELPVGPHAVRPGELDLVFHPVIGGWIGFALTEEGAEARWLGDFAEVALAVEDVQRTANDPARDPRSAQVVTRILLEPFREAISAARRLRVVADGPLSRLSFQSLPWDRGALLDHAPITQRLGLASRSAEPSGLAARGSPAPQALIVADDFLAGAAREADIAASWLRQKGFRVQRLAGSAASSSAVRAALVDPELGLVHIAGHAAHDGQDGLLSSISLPGGGVLTAGDVLALSRVPPRVVLSACETSTAPARSRAAGLGLGQAFVTRGALAVIASTAEIDDAAAADLVGRLYGSGSFDVQHMDLASALRDAQRGHRADGGHAWPLLRVLVP